jgi:IS605 OrfB family transposase
VAAELGQKLDDPVLLEALRSGDLPIRGEAAWYLAKMHCDSPPENPDRFLAAISEAKPVQGEDAELRFGAEILRRVLGRPPVEDEAWIACLDSNPECHLDSDFVQSPLIRFLTPREGAAFFRRSGANLLEVLSVLSGEKPKPPKKTAGKTIAADRGYNAMLYTADGQEIGAEIKPKIQRIQQQKRKKPRTERQVKGFQQRRYEANRTRKYHHYIETEECRLLKTLDLSDTKALVLEELKSVKSHKRGKFSRHVNRLLSFWHYAKVGQRLGQKCEELGVTVIFKDPWKTSQHCPRCHNIDKRNRKGKAFKCLKCGYVDDADHVGALNLDLLGLAGVYSLRDLTSQLFESVKAGIADKLKVQQPLCSRLR